MKKLLKILLAVSIVCGVSLPVLAEIIDVTFNRVSIMVDGNGPLERDQNIKNTELPLSITYKNTTYVPLRFISEQMYKQVQWNGDSKTVSITRKTFGHGNRIKKTDLNGNEWEYQYTRSDDGKKYITVTDSKRNFVRNYPIQGEKAYKTDQESVWFMHTNGILYRLFYANDVNSQDGEEIAVVNSGHPANEAIFDGDYIYSVEKLFSNSSQGNIVVYNMVTNEKVTYPADTWCSFSELSFGRGKTNDENEVVLYFSENSYTGDVYDCRITFNKSDMTFEGFKKGESEKDKKAKQKAEAIAKIKEDGKITLDDSVLLAMAIDDDKENVKDYGFEYEYFVERGAEIYVIPLSDGTNLIKEDPSMGSERLTWELKDGTRVLIEKEWFY